MYSPKYIFSTAWRTSNIHSHTYAMDDKFAPNKKTTTCTCIKPRHRHPGANRGQSCQTLSWWAYSVHSKTKAGEDDLREAIIKQMLKGPNEQCTTLCKKNTTSCFRTIPADELANFKWKDMVADLQQKATLLFTILLVSPGSRYWVDQEKYYFAHTQPSQGHR